MFFTTTSDNRVWALDTPTDTLQIVYDAADGGPLREPDNVTVHGNTSHVFVAEDADDLQLVLLAEQGSEWVASGTRLYFSSQRGTHGKTGMTFEVVGPF